jgi:hypothetical protein
MASALPGQAKIARSTEIFCCSQSPAPLATLWPKAEV